MTEDAQRLRMENAGKPPGQRVGSGGVVVPVVPDPVVPVVPVPVAPAPERVVPVPEVSVVPLMLEPLPDVPEVDEPLLSIDDEPLVPEVDEPLVELGVPSMLLVELGGVLFMLPEPVVPVALEPLLEPEPVAVEPVEPVEPLVPLVPDDVRSWPLVPCCLDLLDFCFLVSLDWCWSLPEVGELVVCAATPALTNRDARITASLLFMSYLLLLVGAVGELPFWHHPHAWRVGERAVRQSELPQAK